MKLLLAFVAIFIMAEAQAAQTSSSAPKCGDFLRQLRLARPDVIFVGCERRGESGTQSESLDATYYVAGKDLAQVEIWLTRTFHAKPLRYVCCGWETTSVSLKARDGMLYEIGLGGETIFNRRRDWPKVPYLTFSVIRYLNEP